MVSKIKVDGITIRPRNLTIGFVICRNSILSLKPRMKFLQLWNSYQVHSTNWTSLRNLVQGIYHSKLMISDETGTSKEVCWRNSNTKSRTLFRFSKSMEIGAKNSSRLLLDPDRTSRFSTWKIHIIWMSFTCTWKIYVWWKFEMESVQQRLSF